MSLSNIQEDRSSNIILFTHLCLQDIRILYQDFRTTRIYRGAIHFWLRKQTFLSHLCYEIALAKRRKNADRSGLRDTKPGDWSASSCPSIPGLFSGISPPLSLPRDSILSFCPFRVSFLCVSLLFLSFSLLIESAIRYPRRRAVCRSAPPVFQPSLPTPRTNILRLSATSTPHRSSSSASSERPLFLRLLVP